MTRRTAADDFVRAPWWITAALALFFFFGLEPLAMSVAGGDNLFAPMIESGARTLSYLFGGCFAVLALLSLIRVAILRLRSGEGQESVTTPECPLCGGDMIERIARKGANPGQPFWGCEGISWVSGDEKLRRRKLSCTHLIIQFLKEVTQ